MANQIKETNTHYLPNDEQNLDTNTLTSNLAFSISPSTTTVDDINENDDSNSSTDSDNNPKQDLESLKYSYEDNLISNTLLGSQPWRRIHTAQPHKVIWQRIDDGL